MAKQFTVKARFVAEDKASPQITKVEGRFKRLTKTIKASSLAQVASFAAVALAIRGLVRAFGSMIRKANEQEVAVNQLNAALIPLGESAAGVSKRLQEQASALQKLTTFGDEAIIAAQTQIASFIKNEEQIKKATVATLDFATAVGMDLFGASALVAKTLGSTTNAMTRYGVAVEGAVGSTERLESLSEGIARVFGGRAAAATETFAGATKQLSDAFGDLQEQVAGNLTQNTGLIEKIRSTTKALSEAGPAITKTIGFFASLAKGVFRLVDAYVSFFSTITIGAGNLLGLTGNLKQVEVAQSAMEATAKRLGITVEELAERIKRNVAATKAGEVATREASTALEEAKEKAEAAKAALAALANEGAGKAATAMEELAAAIGVVTSAELEQELLKMQTNLEKVRNSTEGNTAEFRRWEQQAVRSIEVLEARIRSLKDGTGDLAIATQENTEATGEATDALEKYGRVVQSDTESVNGLTAATNSLVAAQQIANATVNQFTSAGGEARGRVSFRGGSRLIRDDGKGGAFTPAQVASVDANGNVVQ